MAERSRRVPFALLAVAALVAVAVFVALRGRGDEPGTAPPTTPAVTDPTEGGGTTEPATGAPVVTTAEPASTAASTAAGYTWRPVRIGGGGYITGLDVADDGTLVARSDTYGAYVREPDATEWRQLLTTEAVPAEWRLPKMGKGTNSIAVAPSDPSRIYLMWAGHVFVSDDGGTTLRQTSFAPVSSNSNAPFGRGFGDKLAVDPADPDTVLVGSNDAPLRRSTDGGVTWSDTDVPVGSPQARLVEVTGGELSSVGVTGISFDRTSTTGGSTPVVYAASWGNGVYRSADAGASWSSVGGPEFVIHGDVDASGSYVALTGDRDGPFGLWRLDGTDWTEITPGDWDPGQIGEVENPFLGVSPTEPGLFVIGYATQLFGTADGGEDWTSMSWRDAPDGDVTWAIDPEDDNPYLVAGDLVFDPSSPRRVFLATGEGVQYAELGAELDDTLEWVEHTRGIESMVATEVVSTRNGPPVFGVFDFGQFSGSDSFDDYSLVKGPIDFFSGTTSLAASPFADGFAVSATTDYVQWDRYPISSAYTDDGGASWSVFPSMPKGAESATEFGFGTLAVSEPDNIVWAPGSSWMTETDDFQPYVTTDRGASWRPVELPGVTAYPANSVGGYMFGRNRQTVAADQVRPGTFYLYMLGEGLFRSSDGGATWEERYDGDFSLGDPGFTVLLAAQPGVEGSLFYTDGPAGGHDLTGPQEHGGSPFLRSRDGGATWEQVPGVDKVLTFGFGAPAPGAATAAVYLAGDVNGEYGIWQSTDDAVTWTKLADFPYSVDWVSTISGDQNVYGRVYVGFGGSSYVYGEPTG